jgi:hypothetical protein
VKIRDPDEHNYKSLIHSCCLNRYCMRSPAAVEDADRNRSVHGGSHGKIWLAYRTRPQRPGQSLTRFSGLLVLLQLSGHRKSAAILGP